VDASSYSLLLPKSPSSFTILFVFTFTKILFSNTGLASVFLPESMTSLAARILSLSKTILSMQMSMGTAERQAGGMLTFEGSRGKR